MGRPVGSSVGTLSSPRCEQPLRSRPPVRSRSRDPPAGGPATPHRHALRRVAVRRTHVDAGGTFMGSTDINLDADVVVVGAGMSGLYALKVLRERGFRVVVLERAPGVGGTWFWNRYPGARCDIPSLEYSFGFDPELEQEWVWSEHFAAQPEIERYLNHIADRYDLRPDIRLETGVAAATFHEATDTWFIDTETGEQLRTRFLVMAT